MADTDDAAPPKKEECHKSYVTSSVTVTEKTESSEHVQEARIRFKAITKERMASSMIRAQRQAAAAGMASQSVSCRPVPPTFTFGSGNRPGQDSKLAIALEGVVEKRQQQKTEFVTLNERLADYVEKSRFLEAQNRRLVLESETLKIGYSSEAVNLKARYLLELEEIQRLVDASETARTALSAKVTRVEAKHEAALESLNGMESNSDSNLTAKERLYAQLGEMEGELFTLRSRVNDFDLERKRYADIITHLREEESELRQDLEREKMVTMSTKSAAQQMRDELEFITETHKAKMAEMSILAFRDTTAENRAIWRSEFAEAFRALHEDYMTRLDEIQAEAETSFAVTVQQQQTSSSKDTFEMTHYTIESQRASEQIAFLNRRVADLTTKITQYESQLAQLTSEKTRLTEEWTSTRASLQTELETYRTELVDTRTEVQTILDDKLSLEMEIAVYKELLDSEESRISDRMDVALLEQGRYNARAAQRSMLESQFSGSSIGMANNFGCFGTTTTTRSYHSMTSVARHDT